jgi:hypothetical protein
MTLFNFNTTTSSTTASRGLQSQEKPKGLVKWMSYLIKIGSIVLLLHTLYSIVGNVYMLTTGQPVEGTITNFYREEVSPSYSGRRMSSDARSVKRPVISYEANGEAYEVNGQIIGSIGTNYEMGEKVDLLIMANNPAYSVINSFLEMWFVPMLLIILCFVLFGFGHVFHHIVFIFSRMLKGSF